MATEDEQDPGGWQELAMIASWLESRGMEVPSGPSGYTPYGSPIQQQPQVNPYLPLEMYPETNRNGTPNINDQLTAMGKWDKMLNNPSMAGQAGGGGFGPDSFTATPQWESMPTPKRDDLRRFTQAQGTWEAIAADGLLNRMTPSQVLQAVETAVSQNLVDEPYQSDSIGGKPWQDEVLGFSKKYFEGLASEPDMNSGNPNVRYNNDTGVTEIRVDDGKTEMMQQYDELGLPYPNQEYSMDWYAGTDAGAGNLSGISARKGEFARQIEDMQSPYNQFGQLTDPGARSREAQDMAKQNYYLGGGERNDLNAAALPSAAGGRMTWDDSPATAGQGNQPLADAPVFPHLIAGIEPPTFGQPESSRKPLSLADRVRQQAQARIMAGDTAGRNDAYADQAERQRYIDAGTPNRQTALGKQQNEAKRSNVKRMGADPSRARVRNDDTTAAMIRAIEGSGAETRQLAGITREIMEARRSGRTPYGDATQARARAMMNYGGFLG